MSTAKKKTIKFTVIMTALILTISYFSLLTPTSAYFYKETQEDSGITFANLSVDIDDADSTKVFTEDVELRFKGATKFADYGELLFDDVAVIKNLVITNNGDVPTKIIPRVTPDEDSVNNGLKYIVIMNPSDNETETALSEESALQKGKVKTEIESQLSLFSGEETSVDYSLAISKLNADNEEIKSITLQPGESTKVKVVLWAEYDIVMEKTGGESVWQNAGDVKSIIYKCYVEIIASQLSDNDEAVTEALKEVPTWETTSEENQ